MGGAVIAAAAVAIMVGLASLSGKKKKTKPQLRAPQPPPTRPPSRSPEDIFRAIPQPPPQIPQREIPRLVSQPDLPGEPVPTDPQSGKTLWFFDTRGEVFMAIPRFAPVRIVFETLQDTINKTLGRQALNVDGRIGAQTVEAFTTATAERGFDKAPTSVPALAMNAVKWTEILRKNINRELVGRGFGSPFESLTDLQWHAFQQGLHNNIELLADKVNARFGPHLGTTIQTPDGRQHAATLSGLLGIACRAGMRGAQRWLDHPEDRERFPATTSAFTSTNGIF